MNRPDRLKCANQKKGTEKRTVHNIQNCLESVSQDMISSRKRSYHASLQRHCEKSEHVESAALEKKGIQEQ